MYVPTVRPATEAQRGGLTSTEWPFTRVELVEWAIDNGFHPMEFVEDHCPFLEPLRALPRFAGIVT